MNEQKKMVHYAIIVLLSTCLLISPQPINNNEQQNDNNLKNKIKYDEKNFIDKSDAKTNDNHKISTDKNSGKHNNLNENEPHNPRDVIHTTLNNNDLDKRKILISNTNDNIKFSDDIRLIDNNPNTQTTSNNNNNNNLNYQVDDEYTNGFLVEFSMDSRTVIESIAEQHGFIIDDEIEGLNLYHMIHKSTPTRSKRSLAHLTDALLSDTRIISATQQKVLIRDKRDIIHGKVFHIPVRRVANKSIYHRVNVDHISLVERDGIPLGVEDHMNFRDPYYTDEWYIMNHGQTGGRPGVDMNVVKAWKAGYTGKGVVVCILDDGIDYTHPDLKDNYDAFASTDLNGRDDSPYPRDNDPSNSHGTMCAGEIAAAANNSVCGVGIAYHARIGGIRILDGKVTDHIEAKGLLYQCNYTHIFSASWGPRDDGKTMEAPLPAAKQALENGVQFGRNGLGTIYVWATGNGGLTDDDCNADGYVSSIETLSVGSITDRGERPYFMEICPSTMVVVPTGGMTSLTVDEMQIRPTIKVVTTDLHHDCTLEFQGTSSAAPLGAGCIALVLQANPQLTWRDVQHIVVKSARIPGISGTWFMNGAGFHLSDYFGFGTMDCARMVTMATSWEMVPPKRVCVVERTDVGRHITSGQTISFKLNTDACSGSHDHIDQLEHVQLYLSMNHTRRGDIQILLTSPQGMTSEMLSPRPNDDWNKGLNFTFMTIRSWGEIGAGDWLLQIHDRGDMNGRSNHGTVVEFKLILHGYERRRDVKFDASKRAFKMSTQQVSDLMVFEARRSKLLVVPKYNESCGVDNGSVVENSHPEVKSVKTFLNLKNDEVKSQSNSDGFGVKMKNDHKKSDVKKVSLEVEVIKSILQNVKSNKISSEKRNKYRRKIIDILNRDKNRKNVDILNLAGKKLEDSKSKITKKEETHDKDIIDKVIALVKKYQSVSKSVAQTKRVIKSRTGNKKSRKSDLYGALEKVQNLTPV